jgi:heme exporter protein A
MSIQAVKISKSYGNRKVLRNLDFNADTGEIVALIGSNGVGKTTLLRILAMLMKPDHGQVFLDSIPAESQPALLRRKIGVVLHASMLYPDLTAEENLRFFRKLYNLPGNLAEISKLLGEVKLEKRSKDLVRTFSRGMQQRISIARALVHDPACLLMDEPYTGLDQDSCDWLDGLLRNFAAQGKTILLTTHDLVHITAISTRVDILHHGSIVRSFQSAHISPVELADAYRQINTPSSERTASV